MGECRARGPAPPPPATPRPDCEGSCQIGDICARPQAVYQTMEMATTKQLVMAKARLEMATAKVQHMGMATTKQMVMAKAKLGMAKAKLAMAMTRRVAHVNDVVVGNHHGLRITCRARGVDERSAMTRYGLRDSGVQLSVTLGGAPTPQEPSN